MTTIQTRDSVPGTLVPPGGKGWRLHLMTERAADQAWVVAWVRETLRCVECRCADDACTICVISPECRACRGTGYVPDLYK